MRADNGVYVTFEELLQGLHPVDHVDLLDHIVAIELELLVRESSALIAAAALVHDHATQR